MIVIDTSAIIAILNDEAEAKGFRALIVRDAEPLVSAVSLYEAMLVWRRTKGAEASRDVNDFMTEIEATIIPFDGADSEQAFQGYLRFGRGLHSKARLNLCDCVAFALAEKLGLPLLFKGNDFTNTSITSAIETR